MNDLLANIDKIHTTALGIIRIKKNLELESDDVVNWCKSKTKKELTEYGYQVGKISLKEQTVVFNRIY